MLSDLVKVGEAAARQAHLIQANVCTACSDGLSLDFRHGA
jgi:hypothetical protein